MEADKDAWWEGKGLYSGDQNLSYHHPQQQQQQQQQQPSGSLSATAQCADKKTYSMILPPPNITGKLHIGHALTVSIQDVVARWKRMCGYDVLWVPGLDHAGIATQTVVEKILQRDRGQTRHDLGREAFLDEVWAWHEQYEASISLQLRRLGASLDWDREYFTLDEQRSRAVVEAFAQLGEMGLLYRASRMINWCPALQTVISDVEVDHVEVDGRTRLRLPGSDSSDEGAKQNMNSRQDAGGRPGFVDVGLLDSFAYEVVASAEPNAPVVGEIVVSTTRLETMLGDAAVAVHPEDPRYSLHLQNGHFVKHPIHGTALPIIGDAELVDMQFGTGAVKITPGHDPNDFACAQRHGLAVSTMFNGDATITAEAGGGGQEQGGYAGIDRFAARERLRHDLERRGLYRGCEEHAMTIQVCSRTGDILEPLIRPQWFVRVTDMCERARDQVIAGVKGNTEASNVEKRSLRLAAQPKSQMLPEREVVEWNRWLTDPPDWCVSRQLWWGHRIPAFRVGFGGGCAAEGTPDIQQQLGTLVSAASLSASGDPCITFAEEDGLWVVARSEEAARDRVIQWLRTNAVEPTTVEKAISSMQLSQDEDVLDTWFSSGLLPLSALGWPAKQGPSSGATSERDILHGCADQRYYPLSLMETGSDILFFWVARMAMLCTEIDSWHGRSTTPGMDAKGTSPRMPFETVLFHPLVRDRSGKKMSKSLGNVIDPMDVIHGISLDTMQTNLANSNLPAHEIERASKLLAVEYPDGIPECGADALRFALAGYVQHGKPINLDLQRVVAARLFCNKVWQAVRFLDMHAGKNSVQTGQQQSCHVMDVPFLLPRSVKTSSCDGNVLDARFVASDSLGLAQRWILSRLASTVSECNVALAGFDFGSAANTLQRFFEDDLCDNYIEWSKLAFINSNEDSSHSADNTTHHGIADAVSGSGHECYVVLWHCIETWLRLAHPIVPFLSEELWQHMVVRKGPFLDSSVRAHMESVGDSITQYPYPQPQLYSDAGYQDAVSELNMRFFVESVHSFRSLFQTARPALGSEYLLKCSAVLRVDASSDAAATAGVDEFLCVIEQGLPSLSRFAKIEGGIELVVCEPDEHELEFTGEQPAELSRVVEGYDGCTVGLRLGVADAADIEHISREVQRLEKRLTKAKKQLQGVEKRLSSEPYRARASVSERAYHECLGVKK